MAGDIGRHFNQILDAEDWFFFFLRAPKRQDLFLHRCIIVSELTALCVIKKSIKLSLHFGFKYIIGQSAAVILITVCSREPSGNSLKSTIIIERML